MMEFREWLEQQAEHSGNLAEAAKNDSRKGVAFKQKALDDLETGVFASRLADKLQEKPAKGSYGDFLYRSVRSQGDVLGDMNWEMWEVRIVLASQTRRLPAIVGAAKMNSTEFGAGRPKPAKSFREPSPTCWMPTRLPCRTTRKSSSMPWIY